MFRRLISSRGSSRSKLEGDPEDISSTSASQSEESEIVTKLDIPSLMRRHSFAVPSSSKLLDYNGDDCSNGELDSTLDPFDSASTLRKSKSFQCISKTFSLTNLNNTSPKKSVRFNEDIPNLKPPLGVDFTKKEINNIEGEAVKINEDPDSSNYDYSQDNISLYNKDININNYKQYQNQFQNQFTEDDSVSKENIDEGDRTNSKETNSKDKTWFETVTSDLKHLNLMKHNGDLELDTNKPSTSLKPIPETSNEDSTIENSQGLIKSIMNFQPSSSREVTKELVEEIIEELDLQVTLDKGVIPVLEKVLEKTKDIKDTILQKDLDLALMMGKMETFDVIEDELKTLQQDHEELKENDSRNTNALDQLFYKEEQALKQVNELTKENHHLRDKIDNLNGKLMVYDIQQENELKVRSRIGKILGTGNDIEKLETKVKDIIQMNEEQKTQLDELINNYQELQKSHELSEVKNKELSENLNTITEQKKQLESEYTNSETNLKLEIETKNRYNQELLQKNSISQTEVAAKNEEITVLENQLYQVQSNNIRLEKERNSLKVFNQKHIDEIEKLNRKLDISTERINQETNKVNGLNAQLNEVYSKQNNSLEELKNRNLDITEKLESTKKELMTVIQDSMTKEIAIKEMSMKQTTLEQRNHLLEGEKDYLINRNKQSDSQTNKIIGILNDLKGQLQQTGSHKDTILGQMNTFFISNKVTAEGLSQLTKDIIETLVPVLDQDSTLYIENLSKGITSTKVFNENHSELITTVNSFLVKTVSDTVTRHLENENLLKREIQTREVNYNNMIDRFGHVMLQNLKQVNPNIDVTGFPESTITEALIEKSLDDIQLKKKKYHKSRKT